MSLRVSRRVLDEIARHAVEGYPHEVCGLLLAPGGSRSTTSVVESFRLENERVDSRENRYAVSARSMFRAERYAARSGLDVAGYYHSHPNAPARPSGYDLDHATWPGISYPIVSVIDAVAVDVRSWTLSDDRTRFDEEEIVVELEDESQL